MTAQRTSRALLAALAATALLTGCENVPTNTDLPPLPKSKGADQDLGKGLERDRREGAPLALETRGGIYNTQRIYLKPPPKRRYPLREATRAEQIAIRRFLTDLVAAASRRDPSLCERYFSMKHMVDMTRVGPDRAIAACHAEVLAASGNVRFLGLGRIGPRRTGSFTVEFSTRGGRKTKHHNVRLVPTNGTFVVGSGRSSVL